MANAFIYGPPAGAQVEAVSSPPSISEIVPCSIKTYGDAWDGAIAFGLLNVTNPAHQNQYLVVMKTNGELEYAEKSNGDFIVKPILQDALMYTGSGYYWGGGDINFLNLTTNQTTSFPNILTHHDVDYDPINNTFLTLEAYVRNINGHDTLLDKIVEVNSTGRVLWTWDTYDHISISDASPFNETTVVGNETVIDFTHCNAIQWDYNDSIIYLNVRNLNTFYKIDEKTGDIIWGCGQHGNFTLLNANDERVSSLWYHSHGLREVESDVFAMFDNDYFNQTNPGDAYSRMIEITLNEQSMTAWVSWSWTAPKEYYSPVFGSVERLPNGDRLGVFGFWTKQYNSSIGAVLVEVNNRGQVVRTWTFPPGWGIYRVEEMPTVPTEINNVWIALFLIVPPVILIAIVGALYLSDKRARNRNR
jgi:hypothetical protein